MDSGQLAPPALGDLGEAGGKHRTRRNR
jgi:hypothetical protein